MSITRRLQLAVLGACVALVPAFAQAQMTKTTTTTTKTTVHSSKSKRVAMRGTSRERVWNDSSRLAALLSDAQKTINFDSNTWRVVANEANMLSNRIYANASSKTARNAAKELRMHVRQFRDAAMNGDATSARTHASEALPFAYQLIDWSGAKA